MKFMRVHGRVIPIKEGSAEQHRNSARKSATVIGASAGAAAMGIHETMIQARKHAALKGAGQSGLAHQAFKAATRSGKFVNAAAAIMIGASVHNLVQNRKADKLQGKVSFGKVVGENFKQTGLAVAGAVGAVGAYAATLGVGKAISKVTQHIPGMKQNIKDKVTKFKRERTVVKTHGKVYNPRQKRLT